MLDAVEFERLKTRVRDCTGKQKKELLMLLSALTKEEERGRYTEGVSRVDRDLFLLVREVRDSRLGAPTEFSFRELRRFDFLAAERLHPVAVHFEDALSRLFRSSNRLQRLALRRFIVTVAANKCMEDEVTPTYANILGMLMPLESLLDAQFPGYRASGILEEVIMQQIIKGAVTCLEKIPSASKN